MALRGDDLPLEVKVWGDWACFTRPEMKVERVSYPVMTPSAARGVLESIFWKPEFVWRIEEIWVLKPIRYFSILRNEVNSTVSERAARDWSQRGGGFVASEDRAQRHTLALRDVAYLIRANALPYSGLPADSAKYRDQFRRRVERGRCFSPPYLGCREFAAGFGEPNGAERAEAGTFDLGRMLLEIRYTTDRSGRAGRGEPIFFNARLEDGVLQVPSVSSEGG